MLISWKTHKIVCTVDANQLTSVTKGLGNFTVVGELNSNIPRMSVALASPWASTCYYKGYPNIQQTGRNGFVISQVRTCKLEVIYFENKKQIMSNIV